MAVRGGGHNGAGLGVCDGGLVIDLSPMRGIRVDPEARTVTVQGGCVWGDVDHACHAFGLAVPSGIVSSTGVGGLTLGGGIGHLTRKYGLTIDNLLAADVVLANGEFVTASPDRNPDLFWALRGGGGNFGVVTSFVFQAHPVHTVVAGITFWPMDQAGDVMKKYSEFIAGAPEDVNGFFALFRVPPLDVFPPDLHGEHMCGIWWCCTGTEADAGQATLPMRRFGKASIDAVGPMPFPIVQSQFDPLLPPGLQWYWRGDFVSELTEKPIGLHLLHGSRIPSALSCMHLYPIDGAAHRVAPSETAFGNRHARWAKVIAGIDPDPANAPVITEWAKNYWSDLHPYGAGGSYINFMMEEGQERVKASYGDNYHRLATIKRKYDPENLFRVNQNIRPATS